MLFLIAIGSKEIAIFQNVCMIKGLNPLPYFIVIDCVKHL